MAHMSYSAYYIIARIRLLTSLATSLGLRLLQLTGVSGLTARQGQEPRGGRGGGHGLHGPQRRRAPAV